MSKFECFRIEGIQIRYLSPIDGSAEQEEAVHLFVDNTGVSIMQGIPVDLVQHGTITRFRILKGPSGQIQEDRREFPAIEVGSITFDGFTITPGETIRGHFQVIFAGGDTLLADFKSTLVLGDSAEL